MKEKTDNYQWLEKLINSMPELPKERKNFFDISGFPNWENVNSNFLAFYLQENEQHNFKSLFYNSLLECIQNKTCSSTDKNKEGKIIFDREKYEGSFKVYREYTTQKGGRIDLLLESEGNDSEVAAAEEELEVKEDWAIIIENKIDHELENDLNDYWKTVKAKNKIGIVLSKLKTNLKPYKLNNGVEYISITHKELVSEIEKNLSEFFLEGDDRHLMFLKEYFLNIKNLYKNHNPGYIMKEQLLKFHQEENNIIKLINTNSELLNYVNKESNAAFAQLGCEPSTTTIGTRFKHYYFDPKNDVFKKQNWDNNITDKFRFYVDMNRLRYRDNYWCTFEIYGKDNSKNAEKLIEILTERKYKFPYELKTYPGKASNQTHIFGISFKMNELHNSDYKTVVAKGIKDGLTIKEDLDVLGLVFDAWKAITN
jgi:hypothetical protein